MQSAIDSSEIQFSSAKDHRGPLDFQCTGPCVREQGDSVAVLRTNINLFDGSFVRRDSVAINDATCLVRVDCPIPGSGSNRNSVVNNCSQLVVSLQKTALDRWIQGRAIKLKIERESTFLH